MGQGRVGGGDRTAVRLDTCALVFSVQDRNAQKRAEKKASAESPARLIDARIKELNDWRGTALSRIRALIKQADVVHNTS